VLSGWRHFLAGSSPHPACFGLGTRTSFCCLPGPWVQDAAAGDPESGLGTALCSGGLQVAAEQGDLLL